MRVTEDGVPVENLIQAVKNAVRAAGISDADTERDLRVEALRLELHVVATQSVGGGLRFCVPVIGMELRLGGRLTRQDTHEISIGLAPPDVSGRPELRGADIETTLSDAIATIRAAVAGAAGGDDPFTLTDSSVEISFAVTADGEISLGVDASLKDEITQKLTVSLKPA
jgi:hypothetical protein